MSVPEPSLNKSAREAIQQNPLITNTAEIDLHATRFFVQMGWGTLRVDSHAVTNGHLLRGEITPCASFRATDALAEIPEGALIRGSERRDSENQIVYGQYWKTAHDEAERLAALEAMKEAKDGLVEVKALAGQAALYQKIDFNALFFPQGLHALPVKNADLKAHLRAKLAELEGSQSEKLPPHIQAIVLDVARELIAAVDTADSIQRTRIELTHRSFEVPLNDVSGLHKRGYDPVDEEMLVRTGIPRISEEKIKLAVAVETLADNQTRQMNSGDSGMAALVEQLRIQSAQQAALIERLLADREAPPATVPASVSSVKSKKSVEASV